MLPGQQLVDLATLCDPPAQVLFPPVLLRLKFPTHRALTSVGMNSTLLAPSDPLDVRPHDSDKPISFNQLGCQWNGGSPDNGLMMKEQDSLPLSTAVFGCNDYLTCLDGPMADLDAGRNAMGERSNNVTQFSDLFRTQMDISPTDRSSPSSNSSVLAQDVAIDAIRPSESLPPKTKPTTIKKRGRPRKTQPAAVATAVSKSEAGTKSRRPAPGTRSDAEASGAEHAKALRVREKNRIAAYNCRSRRRQEEDKLKAKHEVLEQEHRRLLEALSDQMAETYLLKNMLMAHGSCDCRLIQDYLKESAADWVAKKLKASAGAVLLNVQ
ncbi:hypothetical protein PCL_07260 [Purpureocillium lilacinum]|uniref:BZIP domain-containing protein n=1 Tax=Purpureocillium lilacinum TaxID=33203 RepID=A0A2U3DSG8_PURLI|nr:hypothetical protein PCL_07260 [Purpureocillium lilacinum]